MGLGNFAKWFGLQVQIDDADRTATRAMDAACHAIANRDDRVQGHHLIDTAYRVANHAAFLEHVQKGFENDDAG